LVAVTVQAISIAMFHICRTWRLKSPVREAYSPDIFEMSGEKYSHFILKIKYLQRLF